MKHKLIILALVFSLVFVSQNTFSLGMGKMQVNSALDEPLNATIDIIANSDESVEQISARLASSDDYKKVGLDKSFVPANIMVSVDEDNPYQINLSSNGPISEPIVSLLLDVKWANGRILREFTLLLDPPSYQASASGSVSMPKVDPEPVQEQADTLADVQDDAVTAQSDDIPPVSRDLNEVDENLDTNMSDTDQDDTEFTVETPMEENVSDTLSVMPGEVYVDAGDTLWSIANQNKPGDVTTHQMMMAIYNKNPDAFLNNNVNKMIKGSTLQMPDADSADDLSYQEALAEFESHNSRWDSADDSYRSFQTESDVDDTSAVADTTDYGVQLSGGEGDDVDSQQTEGDIADSGNAGMSDEEVFNTNSENEALKSRVSELENIVNEQQSALELQDDDMANLENQMAQTSEDDTLTTGDFDVESEAGTEESVSDNTLAEDAMTDDAVGEDVTGDDVTGDDVWDTGITEDDALTDTGTELADGIGEQDTVDTADSFDETAPTEELAEDVADKDENLVAEPAQTPVRVSEPWYTPVMNWIEQNILWVIIGLVVLFLIVLLPRLFNRGDEDPAEESSFLDDIKSSRDQAKAGTVEEDLQTLDEDEETVLTAPVSVDDDEDSEDTSDDVLGSDDDTAEEDDDQDDDVLAELDNSLAFDDDDDEDDDDFDFDFDDDDTSASDDSSDEDTVDDLNYETPTKEYDPAPFKDEDDSFDDDFDLSDLDDDLDEELDADLDDDVKSEESQDESIVDTEATVETDLFDDDEMDLEAELSELDDEETEVIEMDADEDLMEETGQASNDFSDDDFLADLDTVDDLDDDSSEADTSGDELADALEDESDDGFEESLSLDEDEEATTFETEQADDDMDEDIDLGLDDLMDEGDVIETKLDLAKAYIEMGDTEGAKNLLDEVKAEGNDDQQAEANKLLDDM